MVRTRVQIKHLVVGMGLLILTACQIVPEDTLEPVVVPPSAEEVEVSKALLKRSRSLRKQGHYREAAAVTERALRIQPSNAAMWLELAMIRYSQNDYGQAEALARKALTLSNQNQQVAQSANNLLKQVSLLK